MTVLGAGLLAAVPARAGAWEETLLDPPPARVEAGVTYLFGYWVLQHGSYPFRGDLGPTMLRATDEEGAVADFPGRETGTPGHYAAEVVFPHDGEWTIGSQHEVIMPDPLVATVTVPGRVAIAPSQVAVRAPYDWGTVRPSFPPADPAGVMAAPAVAPGPTSVAPLVDPAEAGAPPRGDGTTGAATTDAPAAALPVWLPAAGGAVVLGLALWLTRRYRRANG